MDAGRVFCLERCQVIDQAVSAEPGGCFRFFLRTSITFLKGLYSSSVQGTREGGTAWEPLLERTIVITIST